MLEKSNSSNLSSLAKCALLSKKPLKHCSVVCSAKREGDINTISKKRIILFIVFIFFNKPSLVSIL
ncbi:hypothetical protein EII16_10490 [Campylobacter rectus]|nr:hypothetical protein EII16_10490 [Campylobacter rectus]